MKDKLLRWIPFVCLYIPFRLFSLFGSKKNVYLFGTGTGYFHDNPKYLFLEFLKLSNIRVYWIAKNRDTYNYLKQNGFPVLKKNSLFATYYSSIASAFIVSAEIFDVAYFINDYTKLVQLWHGTPIKHIGLDNTVDKERDARKKKWIGKNYSFARFNLFFIDEEEYIPIFQSAFGCEKKKIKVYGQIRNIVFNNHVLKEKIKKELSLFDFEKVILYAPTYRDTLQENIKLIQSFFSELDMHKIRKNNFILLIKLHPFLTNGTLNFPRQIINHENVLDVSSHTDSQELLLVSDLLITDLSSCALDYKYLGNPVFSFFPDKEEYIKNRDGVYFTYTSLLESNQDICSIFNKFDNLALNDYKIDVKQIIKAML